MAGADIDIKSLLEQDRLMVLELIDTARKLVLDVKAAHYWTAYSLEVLGSLRNIGGNLARLLDTCSTHWDEGKRVFNRAEGMKLWNTALGLWQAMPPVRTKFTEQLARRRRERIMGQALTEMEDVGEAEAAADLERFTQECQQLAELFASFGPAVEAVPSGLVPVLQSQPTAPNGQMEEVSEGAPVSDIAAPLPESKASALAGEERPGQSPPSVEGDELTAV